MKHPNRFALSKRLATGLIALTFVAAACGSSDDDAASSTSGSDTSAADSSSVESASGLSALFRDGALTSDVEVVDCTLESGTETSCYQLEVASLASTVETEGPFCPETIEDTGGIWVWDGEDPGLYALDSDFWQMMVDQGYEFSDAEGTISVVDPAGGAPSSAGTENSCLEASPDGSFHLQVLLPVTPEDLDSPTDLSTVAQTGVALDGVTIFGDAPSVGDTGGLPALDACGGHIDPSGYYHWHFGAEAIQTNLDRAEADVTCDIAQDYESLIGFAFDGYGIYGPEEDREIPSDLDECSGHVSDTEEFGERYHYHLTYDSPNLPTCRVGATANSKLTSPDNSSATLPDGGGAGGGAPGDGPPGGEAPA